MLDLHYLELLSDSFPNIETAAAEMIKLQTICGMPKGTEYFFSDLHGEYEAFVHQLKSASGVIKTHIDEMFFRTMTEKDRLTLAEIIYSPEKIIKAKKKEDGFEEWFRIIVSSLVSVCLDFGGKYTNARVRNKSPKGFELVIDELLHFNGAAPEKHFECIVNSILEAGVEEEFLIGFCKMIRNLSVDRLHIIGDIFDRGPRANMIMEELLRFHEVDIQWGNHDIVWMGAASGNLTCIASVIRTGISYNNFDCLEDGYGINLRPLSMFAAQVYKNDPCEGFMPHLLDESKFDRVSNSLSAKMHKAIAIIQFKLEGRLYKRHPEYNMEDRDLLSKIDFSDYSITIDGKKYMLNDKLFPTVNPENPLELTEEETALMNTLSASFLHSETLQKHIRFLYEKGSMYKLCNNNLLYHGCIPTKEDGSFDEVDFGAGKLSGKAYLDYITDKIRDAYFSSKKVSTDISDFFWFLWCGKKSPLFGKSKLAAFERYFIDDTELCHEEMNSYYKLIEKQEVCRRILDEFGITEGGHIINGHVPVRAGENPVKGEGLLFMIDGGISKAYQPKTGIGGYTFLYSSRYMAFAKHSPNEWQNSRELPTICEVERFTNRMLVEDTDIGKSLLQKINDLKALLEAYRTGQIKENR